MYFARVTFIINRIRPLNILDETKDACGVGGVSKLQVERGDPTLFLHFKNTDYARTFIKVSEKYGILHSKHGYGPRMAAPELDTGKEDTYSKHKLDELAAKLATEIVNTALARIARKHEYFLTTLNDLKLSLDLKEKISAFIHENQTQLQLQIHDTATIVALTDTIDLMYDALTSGNIEQINVILSPERIEEDENAISWLGI